MPELASMAYQVLNAARCWRYLESGELGSKVEGAAWLERRDPDPDTGALLDAALAYQRGGIPNHPDERTVSGCSWSGSGGDAPKHGLLIYGGRQTDLSTRVRTFRSFLDLVAQKYHAVFERGGLDQLQVLPILENARSLAA